MVKTGVVDYEREKFKISSILEHKIVDMFWNAYLLLAVSYVWIC